ILANAPRSQPNTQHNKSKTRLNRKTAQCISPFIRAGFITSSTSFRFSVTLVILVNIFGKLARNLPQQRALWWFGTSHSTGVHIDPETLIQPDVIHLNDAVCCLNQRTSKSGNLTQILRDYIYFGG